MLFQTSYNDVNDTIVAVLSLRDDTITVKRVQEHTSLTSSDHCQSVTTRNDILPRGHSSLHIAVLLFPFVPEWIREREPRCTCRICTCVYVCVSKRMVCTAREHNSHMQLDELLILGNIDFRKEYLKQRL